jgi:hypothetical protein
MDKFKDLEMPKTEYQNNLKELSISPIEQWLKEFTLNNIDKDEVELLGYEAYQFFKLFCERHGIKYEIDSNKLGVRISNLKINGIEKGNHTYKGKTKRYNISKMKKYFGVGCLLDI